MSQGNSFLNILQLLYEHASNASRSDNIQPCVEKIDNYLFYQYSLIPAILMCILFGTTITRQQMYLSKFGGRPGLVYPMDTLTRAHSLSYACAFGATGFVVYRILDEGAFAINYSGPLSLKSLIAVVSMLIYGIVYFPVFSSLALGTAVSYGLGAAYVWMFFIIDVYKLTECHVGAKFRLIAVIQDAPNIACLAYLSVTLPIRCAIAIRNKKYFSSRVDTVKVETLEDIQESYQGIYVMELFRKPVIKPLPVGKMNTVKKKIKDMIHRFIYQWKRGFEYPSRLVSVMFVAGCVIYMVTVTSLVYVVNLLDILMDYLEKTYEQPKASEFFRELAEICIHIVYIFKVSAIVSTIVAALISLFTILHMMTSFRRNLFALYRGDFKNIPPASENSAASLCIGSMKFAGYQVAYIFWAYVLTFIVLLIICLILAVIVRLFIIGETAWLVDYVLQLWPGVLIGIVIYIIQLIVAKLFFLQGKGEYLRLNNRRAYFVLTYFLFFFNIFVGLFSCLMRILKAIAVGVICLARLDNSTLPRAFEFLDPGFNAYRGFIHMEAAHTHPVVNVFIRLLMSMTTHTNRHTRSDLGDNDRQYSMRLPVSGAYDTQKMTSKPRSKDAAKFNWLVTYTLLHNPAIRVYRKGYIQALRKARAEGIKIPISDKPFTDFDLVKSREQKEQEKIEELERIRSTKLDCPSGRTTDLKMDWSKVLSKDADIVQMEDIVTHNLPDRNNRIRNTSV